jgi:aldehyde:ferredoxin oxidoreductase
MHDPMTKGPSAGHVTTEEELEYMKDLYYKAKGWTQDGLIPKKKLIELGMEDVSEEIGV